MNENGPWRKNSRPSPRPDSTAFWGEAGLWRRKLDEHRLSFGVEAFPSSREQFKLFVQQAKDFGVQYINAQVMDSFVTGEDAIVLLKGLLEEAALADIPLFVETHRGRITQDLLRTIEYVRHIPNLILTIDLSHYVLAGEVVRDTERMDPWFDALLERTACLHGRISNGQQIQVEIDPANGQSLAESFFRWWSKGIRYWLSQARPGDILPFVCELGPYPYAIAPRSDRWEQSLVIKKWAEQLWSANS